MRHAGAAERTLPRALVLLAEWDALRQEGERYVRMLQEAGVDTEYRVLNQTHHGFLEDWANRPCYEALLADVREKHDPAFQQAAQWAVTILERFVRRICQPEGPTDNTKD
ncbi:alpha/beta hydrolase fold domain-containing protein [Flavonifractor plautii]|uniref:alpha/beta hydrolase fold domain-containing protein n=1 Tax=Flavonifractor plautii TaxID=292800 RepID=UPI00195DBF77|nr:alpha/beta hydrolase fold domain-containing protein [Flavonifractor plautii]